MGVAVFYLLYLGSIILFILIRRMAFRTSLTWGLVVLLVPFGSMVFAIKHWDEAGKPYLVSLGLSLACVVMMFTVPSVMAIYAHRSPAFVTLAMLINPRAMAEVQAGDAPPPAAAPPARSTPREVRDLAEGETPGDASAVDANAAPRAAYAKHAKELNALYQQLNAERPKLKPGTPATAAFNAKAARYQQGLRALADEKTKLDALDHAGNLNNEAAQALATLRATADAGDYEAFAAVLKKSLADYRATPSFPGTVAFARTALPQASSERVLAGLRRKAQAGAQAEFDKTTRKVQGIVNQVPPIVVPPPGSTEVYKYGYHPGAENPNYQTGDLLGTREIWKGDFAYIENAPGVFYRSADCEFNPQTKFFYLSRNVPKKKLSDAEYKELLDLYHLLGQQEKAIAEVPPPTRDAERVSRDLAALKAQLDGYAMK